MTQGLWRICGDTTAWQPVMAARSILLSLFSAKIKALARQAACADGVSSAAIGGTYTTGRALQTIARPAPTARHSVCFVLSGFNIAIVAGVMTASFGRLVGKGA